jgi:hypothetical protein
MLFFNTEVKQLFHIFRSKGKNKVVKKTSFRLFIKKMKMLMKLTSKFRKEYASAVVTRPKKRNLSTDNTLYQMLNQAGNQ